MQRRGRTRQRLTLCGTSDLYALVKPVNPAGQEPFAANCGEEDCLLEPLGLHKSVNVPDGGGLAWCW
jgi:hypothetical protein